MDFTVSENLRQQALKALLELLKIPSLNAEASEGAPFGRPIAEALEYTLKLGKDLGFEVRNCDGYAGIIDMPNTPQAAEMIGILCHLDVVPPDGDWITPPFAPDIRDGKIYARGVVDDKGPLVAALFAMYMLQNQGVQLNKRVRLICGTDEETGFRCVEHYKANEELPACGFSPDGDFPVVYAEKGISHFELIVPLHTDDMIAGILGGEAANIIPAKAEAVLAAEAVGEELRRFIAEGKYALIDENGCYRIISEGVAAHASLPQYGENAICSLIGALLHCDINFEAKSELEALYRLFCLDHRGAGSCLGLYDDESGGMSLSPDIIALEQGELRIIFDMRYGISDSFGRIEHLIEELCAKYGWQWNLINYKEPLNVGRDSALVKTLNKVYNNSMNEDCEPIAIGGGTYSRAFHNFVAFGPVFPGDEEVAHMTDEYMAIDRFYRLIAIYAEAIYELAK